MLRLQIPTPGVVHWSTDGWHTIHEAEARDTTMGAYITDLQTEKLPTGTTVTFTFYWPEAGQWEGTDFTIVVK